MSNSKEPLIFYPGNKLQVPEDDWGALNLYLGGKGRNLFILQKMGFNVPPFAILPTPFFHKFKENSWNLNSELKEAIRLGIKNIELQTKKTFGDTQGSPLLLSIRSGAPVTLPGLMVSLLNVGLNDQTVETLSKSTQNPSFAWDSYRRLLAGFGQFVYGIDPGIFEQLYRMCFRKYKVEATKEISEEGLKKLVQRYKEVIFDQGFSVFPQNLEEQLFKAVETVARSWEDEKARVYRQFNEIPHHLGTAINFQVMVFGNLDSQSGTGVVMTRNPNTGEKEIFGEFLPLAQGEEVVGGGREPIHFNSTSFGDEKTLPKMVKELVPISQKVESVFKDMQEIEFTIEKGTLYLLQCRQGKRSPTAALKIAVDLIESKELTLSEGMNLVEPNQVLSLMAPKVNTGDIEKFREEDRLIARGLPASNNTASGCIIFTAKRAELMASEGKKVILVRAETSPEDITGIHFAAGILTTRGGMTSHAAVVARARGKACIVGCKEIIVDATLGTLTIPEKNLTLAEGQWITLNGPTGEIFKGKIALHAGAQNNPNLKKILQWAKENKSLTVRGNADSPEEVEIGFQLGAEGIGLYRTEQRFFEEKNFQHVRSLIFSNNTYDRELQLKAIEPDMVEEFIQLFTISRGHPISVRLLDPPLSKFLPKSEEILTNIHERERSGDQKGSLNDLKIYYQKILQLEETNPAFGHRGCRLGITHSEIYKVQVEALFKAVGRFLANGPELNGKKGLKIGKLGQSGKLAKKVQLEILIPLVSTRSELIYLKKLIEEQFNASKLSLGPDFDLKVGIMAEVPRICLLLGEIANDIDFVIFGTRDLTQATFGMSRDDSKFITNYQNLSIWSYDPFDILDLKGVGNLIKMGVDSAKLVNPNLKFGVCGPHTSDIHSMLFFDQIGIDFVCCSPSNIPLTQIASARAHLMGNRGNLKSEVSNGKRGTSSPKPKSEPKKESRKTAST